MLENEARKIKKEKKGNKANEEKIGLAHNLY